MTASHNILLADGALIHTEYTEADHSKMCFCLSLEMCRMTSAICLASVSERLTSSQSSWYLWTTSLSFSSRRLLRSAV